MRSNGKTIEEVAAALETITRLVTNDHDAAVTIHEIIPNDEVRLWAYAPTSGLLVGRGGSTLAALQTLCKAMAWGTGHMLLLELDARIRTQPRNVGGIR